MQKTLKHFLVSLSFLALVGVVLNILIDNPYAHRLIRKHINRLAEDETNVTVDFKAIKVSVIPLGVDLYGVQITPNQPTHPDPASPLLTAAQIKARVSLWALVLGEFRLGLIEAQEATVLWPPPWDFPGFLKATGAPPAVGPAAPLRWPPSIPMPIDRIVLNKSRLALQLPLKSTPPAPLSEMTVTLEGVDLDVNWRSWRRVDLNFNVDAANLAWDGASLIEETSLEGSLALRDEVVAIAALEAKGERLNIPRGQGQIKIATHPDGEIVSFVEATLDLDVDGDISLLGSFLDLERTYGRIVGQTKAKVTIPLGPEGQASFKIEGTAQAQNAVLYGKKLYDSRVQFAVDRDKIQFPAVDIVIDGTRFARGQGTINFDDKVTMEWRVAPDKLHLIDLLGALDVEFPHLDGSIVSDNLLLRGQGDPFRLKVSAEAQVSDLVLPKAPYDHSRFPIPPQCRLALNMAITDQRIDFDQTKGFCFQTKTPASPYASREGLVPPEGAAYGSPVSVSGGLDFTQGLNLTIESQALDIGLGQHFALIPLKGQAVVAVRIVGPFDDVKIGVNAHSPEIEILGAPLGSLNAHAQITGEEIQWKDFFLTPKGGGEIRSDGQLTLDEQLTLQGRFRVAKINPDTMGKILASVSDSARFSMALDQLEGDLEGPLLSPLAMVGRVSVLAREAREGDQLLAEEVRLLIRSQKDGMSLESLRMKHGSLEIVGDAKIKRSRPFTPSDAASSHWLTALGLLPEDHLDLTLRTEAPPKTKDAKSSRTNDHLERIPYAGPYLAKAQMKGQMRFRTRLQGQVKGGLQGTMDGDVNHFELLGSRMGPTGFNGFVRDGRLDLMLTHSGNAMEGRLSLDLMKKGIPYEWFLSLNRLDLRAFLTHAFWGDPRNYLYATAEWRQKGFFQKFWQSKGIIDLKSIRSQYVRDLTGQTRALALAEAQPAQLILGPDGWRFGSPEGLHLTGEHMDIKIQMVDNKPPEKLGIAIDGTLDISVAKYFSKDVDTAEGQIQWRALIEGPIDDPKVRVTANDLGPTSDSTPRVLKEGEKESSDQWRPLVFGLADVRPALRNIKFAASYADGRLSINNFLAEKGSGSISASGALGLTEDAEEGSRLDITLSDATMIYTVAFLRSFETQVSGNLSLAGRGIPFKLSGGLNITKARSTKEVDIRNEIINVLRQKAFVATVVEDQPKLNLDLKINADQSINIHNKNLQTILSTQLSVQGTDIAPQLLGQVEVVKGRFIYKRDFRILRGLINFDDPVRPDPNLDILAMAEVDTYKVYISVSGRASSPTVEFSVDPATRETGKPISKLEILVLLSRGKLPDQTSTVGQETQSAAASEAANLILGQFEEPVEKLFDLSGQNVIRNVYIDTHPSPDGGPVPRLNLPLDLGEDFDVVFRADGQSNEVSGEYHVHDNITFSGVLERRRTDDRALQSRQQQVDAEGKVNLKFRFSFD